MAINKLTLPYSNFNIGSVIDPDEFNANNSAIVTVVNNLVESANMPPVVDDDGNVVLPDYIKETYIDEVELRSPTITGNTFIGSTGMVGMSALGTAEYSVRIWAGGHANNKENAAFRVLQSGEIRMGGTELKPNARILADGSFEAGMGAGSGNYFRVNYNANGVYQQFASSETAYAAARWKRDDANYLYQDPHNFRVYLDGAKFRISSSGDTFVYNNLDVAGDIIAKKLKGNVIDLEASNHININSINPVYVNNRLLPYTNGAHSLGNTGWRWGGVYTVTGGLNESSDIRHKSNIEDIPYDLLKYFSEEVKPKIFDSNGKTHFGYIAQDVERALYKYALNKVGFKKAQEYVNEFNVLGRDESYLSLVYSQIAVIKEAELQDKVDELSKVVQELSDEINSL